MGAFPKKFRKLVINISYLLSLLYVINIILSTWETLRTLPLLSDVDYHDDNKILFEGTANFNSSKVRSIANISQQESLKIDGLRIEQAKYNNLQGSLEIKKLEQIKNDSNNTQKTVMMSTNATQSIQKSISSNSIIESKTNVIDSASTEDNIRQKLSVVDTWRGYDNSRETNFSKVKTILIVVSYCTHEISWLDKTFIRELPTTK
mmetsp:Transcript_1863/g.2278  ORF Transcript_1863/g.2278 Transcript_1863/m.2278 type:complete len:205 (+) Transcript_1863:41-655(+)